MRSTTVDVRKTYSGWQVAVAIAVSGAPESEFPRRGAELFSIGLEKVGDAELAEMAHEAYVMDLRINTAFSVQELAGAWQWVWDNWGSPARMRGAFDAACDLIEEQDRG